MKELKNQIEKADAALQRCEARAGRMGPVAEVIHMDLRKARAAMEAALAQVTLVTGGPVAVDEVDPWRSVRRGTASWRQGLTGPEKGRDK